MTETRAWSAPDQKLVKWIGDHRQRAIDSYKANPLLIEEHGRQEEAFRTGGYAHRQVLELVQNAADALRRGSVRGRVSLVLHENVLYCANEGEPFTKAGLEAVCHAYLSNKRGEEMGRFGLGFKSVLGVTDEPTIFSQSISFGFRADHSRSELSELNTEAQIFPVLRLPFLVDADDEFDSDPILAGLASWASTVIRLPLTRDFARLLLDLQSFPKESLLFAPFIHSLTIAGSKHIEFRCESMEGHEHRWLLHGADGEASEWMVWQRSHRPSEEALQEVGEAIRRDEVTVSYAAPIDDAQSLGRFWAYFPLQEITSARGIHNAPWRINDDRTNLLPGKFNDELLDVAADLIVSALPRLTSPEDPARHFDYLPARGRESQNFADKRLCELVPAFASSRPCVPDATGQLRIPSQIRYPNLDLKLEVESLQLWDAAPGRPVRSPHWACFRSTTRRARLRTLIRQDEAQAAESEVPGIEWLESIVEDGTDAQCDIALQVFFSVREESTRRELISARVVPDVRGNLHRLNQTNDLYLRGNPLSASAGLCLASPSFLDHEHVEARLRSLGFVDVDPKQELLRLAASATNRWAGREWRSFWDLVLEVSVSDAEAILAQHVGQNAVLKVRCRDGSWQHVGTVVVPGIVNPVDRSLTVDTDYHELLLGLLLSLGVSSRPISTPAVMSDMTLLQYQRMVRAEFLQDLPPRGRPQAADINWRETEGPGPLHVLRRFADANDDESQMLWTKELLELRAPETWTLWWVNKAKLLEKRVTAPYLWAAATYGLLDTSWGPRAARLTLHPDLEHFDPVLPVARWAVADRINVIRDLSQVSIEMWREFLSRAPSGGTPAMLGKMVLEALSRLPIGEVPETVPALRRGSLDLAFVQDLIVATTDDEVRALNEQDLPFILVAEDYAQSLIDAWGCQLAADTLRVEWATDTPSEPVMLIDRFRRIRDYADDRLDDMSLVSCSGLLRVVTTAHGTDSRPQDFAVSGQTIYCVRTLADEGLLGQLSTQFDLGLDDQTILRILSAAEDERIQTAMAACRAESTATRKLLSLLPGSSMETGLPAGLLQTVRNLSGDGGDEQIAELLVLVHGYSLLSELRHQLKGTGYPVPEQWAGSNSALGFVQRLGFAAEYAGERGGRLAPDVTVLGPPNLNDLHPYQHELAERIRALARGDTQDMRALLFLPTGAGKTRVTVQALAESIMANEVKGPILWIAQTEELCEQAVQTWSTVWRQFGDRPLRLCRLWSENNPGQSDADASVIVATDAKLDKVREREDYDWLQDTGLVVIDEAHGATGTGITATLRWLGIDGRKSARPLLGLTATPFKGRGEEANKRLANRFGGNLLDVLGDDPYGELQRLKVLARVEHEVLPGSSFASDVAERLYFDTYRDVPKSVLERVGRDESRTMRLLDHIANQPSEWPILVFTSSVLAAQTLSALLKTRGLASGTVSGSTPIKERRRTIEAFRNNEIQVLTNCNVLTQGFDAPGVRALYIARPTFSPNAYIQMVGRGLRGPANGGEEECKIVNVADTFDAFGESLAYNEFEYLWRFQGGEDS